MTYFDPVILLIIGAAVFAEVRRGLYLTLADAVRIAVALGIGLLGFRITVGLGGGATAGLAVFAVLAIGAVLAAAALLKKMGLDPFWSKTLSGRILAGIGGFLLGLAICVVTVPVFGRMPLLRPALMGSPLAQPFLSYMPRIYQTADRLDITFPQLSSGRITIEQEGGVNTGAFTDRINFTKLDGATCIECGASVRFEGYHRRGTAVSPRFVCTGCGRKSDGCQAFEGFHQMYGRCPIDYTRRGKEIDCGVWPNDRPVIPVGECPVCGLARW